MLNKPIDLKLEHVPQIMHSCFVLYSFCEINGMRLGNDRVQRQIELDKQVQPNVAPDRFFSYNSVDGERVRNVIIAYIKEHLPDCLS